MFSKRLIKPVVVSNMNMSIIDTISYDQAELEGMDTSKLLCQLIARRDLDRPKREGRLLLKVYEEKLKVATGKLVDGLKGIGLDKFASAVIQLYEESFPIQDPVDDQPAQIAPELPPGYEVEEIGVRMIEGDMHFGYMGLGSMTASAADTFSATIIDGIVEPDLIISNKATKKVLEIDIEDVLVWDARESRWETTNSPDITSGGDILQSDKVGMTKDNTTNGTDAPTAGSQAEGTRPGGNGASVTGAAAGGPGTRTQGDEQPTRHWESLELFATSNETVDATGQANHTFNRQHRRQYTKYQDDSGVDAHRLMTAAHYHLWGVSVNTGNISTYNVGIDTRRVSIDLKELMFDRAVLLSILDALVVSS